MATQRAPRIKGRKAPISAEEKALGIRPLAAVDNVDPIPDAETYAVGIPKPSAIMRAWLRTAVKLPGEKQPWQDCKVYACPEGLYVYRSVPEDGWTPDWYGEMPPQPPPVTGVMARMGFNIGTVRGSVVLTPSGACSCSAPLKRFNPDFAGRMVRWPA